MPCWLQVKIISDRNYDFTNGGSGDAILFSDLRLALWVFIYDRQITFCLHGKLSRLRITQRVKQSNGGLVAKGSTPPPSSLLQFPVAPERSEDSG
jgi:hypothetical protein